MHLRVVHCTVSLVYTMPYRTRTRVQSPEVSLQTMRHPRNMGFIGTYEKTVWNLALLNFDLHLCLP